MQIGRDEDADMTTQGQSSHRQDGKVKLLAAASALCVVAVALFLPSSELFVNTPALAASGSPTPVGEVSFAGKARQTVRPSATPPIVAVRATPTPTPFFDDMHHIDDRVRISVEKIQSGGVTYYAADIIIQEASQFKSAFAQGKYGKSYRAYTSKIARDNDAILVVNGDYYGFRNDGIVIRNGELFRNKPGNRELLIVGKNGDFSIQNEQDVDVQALIDDDVWQTYSFGPTLVKNAEVQEIAKDTGNRLSARALEPRCAIGQVGKLHYKFVVVDGRQKGSKGMSLPDLAELMEKLGCKTAYNLDGGGSATMVLNERVVNSVSGGAERSISDIVYIGR